jgi:hypothetical protein
VRARELHRRLEGVAVPDEHGALERSWALVSAAHATRDAVPQPRSRLRPLVAVAVALALVAAAASAPGRAVLSEVREAIVGVPEAEPALFELPAPGRLLVGSREGVWVVATDGAKRLLAGRREASWSPHGRFLVAAKANELAAIEPGGRVRWSLARRNVRHPRWGGTFTDTRIAYLSGASLRVVAGDGTGDRVLARAVARVAPAWRPGARHVLAYVGGDGAVHVVEADSGRERARWREGRPEQLLWSADGAWLAARGGGLVSVYTAEGRRVVGISNRSFGEGNPFLTAAFAPFGRQLALVAYDPQQDRSTLRVGVPGRSDRNVFAGAGRFTQLAWSPNGEWLLVAWRDADQWVFVRSARVREIRAVAGVTEQFGGTFPFVSGWSSVGDERPPAAAPAPTRRVAAPAAARRVAAATPAPKAPMPRLTVRWHRSTALGLPHAGTLVQGVEFPREGPTFFTWHPVRRASPNPRWRRYGTDRVVRIVLRILEQYAAAHPGAPRVGVGDLSRPEGGPFGPKHVSHQNGLDVDVYFPRLDRRERPPDRAEQIDRRLAQDLVDRFVAAGAERVFVGPLTGLTGPRGVVAVLAHHDNHLHARFPNG